MGVEKARVVTRLTKPLFILFILFVKLLFSE